MAFNGSGTFVRLYNWVNDRDAAIPITASRMDGEQDGFATGLSTCITKDGQTTITANLPMNTFKHTGVGNANARDQYSAAGQIQDNSLKFITGAGTANAQTLTLAPAITAYVDGMSLFFEAGATNTGACTLNVNSVGADSIVMPNGDALSAGVITTGKLYHVIYDAANTNWVLIGGNHISTGFSIVTNATTTNPISIGGNTVTTGDVINVAANALTTGSALSIASSSSSASTRNLAEIINSDGGSGGTTCLFLSQAADQQALQITSANSSEFAMYIQCDSATSGGALSISSNSSSGSVRNLVEIINDNASAGGTRALFIDQDADGRSIYILTSGQTANCIDITASSLTTGAAIRAYSNAPSTGGRNVVEIINDNSAATSANALHIQQDSSADAISIAHNGNGLALDIDGTNSSADVMQVTANSLTTASLARFSSNSSSTGTRNLVAVVNDNTSATNATCLSLQQDAAATGIFVDQNGNGLGVFVDAATTTSYAASIVVDSATTGGGLTIASSSTDNNARALLTITTSSTSAQNARCLDLVSAANTQLIIPFSSFATYASQCLDIRITRAASSAYSFAVYRSGNTSDVEFNFRGDGEAFADGSFTGGGADYAEYFEWDDGNLDNEDRRGLSVCLLGDKIRLAGIVDKAADIIGVVSANPTVVGDAQWNKWAGKYLRDDFGSYIMEEYTVEGEDGMVVQQRRKLNPEWDPTREYIPREQRKEWSPIGLMGKLRLRKGQPTNPNWIKLRDISENIEEWLIK